MVSVISFILGSVEEMSRSEHWRKAQDHLSQRTETRFETLQYQLFSGVGNTPYEGQLRDALLQQS